MYNYLQYNNLNPIRYTKVKLIGVTHKSNTSYLLLRALRGRGAIHIQITLKSTTIIMPKALCCSSGTYIIIPLRPSNHSRCKSIVGRDLWTTRRGPNYCHEGDSKTFYITLLRIYCPPHSCCRH